MEVSTLLRREIPVFWGVSFVRSNSYIVCSSGSQGFQEVCGRELENCKHVYVPLLFQGNAMGGTGVAVFGNKIRILSVIRSICVTAVSDQWFPHLVEWCSRRFHRGAFLTCLSARASIF
jgi:hypothetical protein